MKEENGHRKVFHYLHNSASGAVEAEWQGGVLTVKLPDLLGNERIYNLNVDVRDKRTLVIFDGHIPWGGLPKNCKVVLSTDRIQSIATSIENVRNPRVEEETRISSFNFQDNNEIAVIPIKRNFLLLPKSVACVRKYDAKSLRPIYTFIEVNEKGVTWRTSSY